MVDMSHTKLWKRQQGFDYWTQHMDDKNFWNSMPKLLIDEYINALETRQKIWYVWMRGYTYYAPKVRVDWFLEDWR